MCVLARTRRRFHDNAIVVIIVTVVALRGAHVTDPITAAAYYGSLSDVKIRVVFFSEITSESFFLDTPAKTFTRQLRATRLRFPTTMTDTRAPQCRTCTCAPSDVVRKPSAFGVQSSRHRRHGRRSGRGFRSTAFCAKFRSGLKDTRSAVFRPAGLVISRSQ